MFKHTIYITKLFSEDRRIAFHLASDVDSNLLQDNSGIISEKLSGYEYSIHSIIDNDLTVNSLVEKDPFFEGVYFYEDFNQFLEEIKKDGSLTSLDVGRYIAAKLQEDNITAYHTKLQKLVYLAYESYLANYGDKLFKDKIEAWQFGPVQRDLYLYIKNGVDDLVDTKKIRINSSSSDQSLRILYSKNGINKLKAIDEAYEKFKNFSSNDLVKYTHKADSAWSKSYVSDQKLPITDEKILESYKI